MVNSMETFFTLGCLHLDLLISRTMGLVIGTASVTMSLYGVTTVFVHDVLIPGRIYATTLVLPLLSELGSKDDRTD